MSRLHQTSKQPPQLKRASQLMSNFTIPFVNGPRGEQHKSHNDSSVKAMQRLGLVTHASRAHQIHRMQGQRRDGPLPLFTFPTSSLRHSSYVKSKGPSHGTKYVNLAKPCIQIVQANDHVSPGSRRVAARNHQAELEKQRAERGNASEQVAERAKARYSSCKLEKTRWMD
jgi:hypothetical protein